MIAGCGAKRAGRCGIRTLSRTIRRMTVAGGMLLVGSVAPPSLIAQLPDVWRGLFVPFAGSQAEEHLRALQALGETPLYPWAIRGFSFMETDRLAGARPTQIRFAADSASHFAFLPVEGRVVYNTAFPYRNGDGPVWTGRGLTSYVTAGGIGAIGPLSIVFAPFAFRAENREFPLIPNGQEGAARFAHERLPGRIDLPQRFGDQAYNRVGFGESTLRLDLAGVAVGASTAAQVWGPATDHPILLGTNAGGFPHVFLGSGSPLDIFIGRIHGRVVWGRLSESPYSPMADDDRWRLFSGYVVTFIPRGAPGLEVGLARAFHTLLDGGVGFAQLVKPFESFLKAGLSETGLGPDGVSDVENQLASVFFRWVLPPSGVEVYGEYGREDHNWDLRDFLLEPDQQRAYMIGARKAWQLDEGLILLSGEVANSQISNIAQFRGQAPFYTHTRIRQGHTHRGLALGSPDVALGGGSVVRLALHRDQAQAAVEWRRRNLDPGLAVLPVETRIQHSAAAEGTYVVDGRYAVKAGLEGTVDLNRMAPGDRTNLRIILGVRGVVR